MDYNAAQLCVNSADEEVHCNAQPKKPYSPPEVSLLESFNIAGGAQESSGSGWRWIS